MEPHELLCANLLELLQRLQDISFERVHVRRYLNLLFPGEREVDEGLLELKHLGGKLNYV